MVYVGKDGLAKNDDYVFIHSASKECLQTVMQ